MARECGEWYTTNLYFFFLFVCGVVVEKSVYIPFEPGLALEGAMRSLCMVG